MNNTIPPLPDPPIDPPCKICGRTMTLTGQNNLTRRYYFTCTNKRHRKTLTFKFWLSELRTIANRRQAA